MWIPTNPNPLGKEVPDCVIRAISIAYKTDWYTIYDALYAIGREECSVSPDDDVWGEFLYQNGGKPFELPKSCPECVTVEAFCRMYPEGTYIIGTGIHAVAVINGNYYDSWDSGNEIPSFFWKIR